MVVGGGFCDQVQVASRAVLDSFQRGADTKLGLRGMCVNLVH